MKKTNKKRVRSDKELIRFNTNGINGRGGKIFFIYNTSDEDLIAGMNLKSKKNLNIKIYESKNKEKTETSFRQDVVRDISIVNNKSKDKITLKSGYTYKISCGGEYPYIISIFRTRIKDKNKFETYDIAYDWETR